MMLDTKALFAEHFASAVEEERKRTSADPSSWIKTGRASKAWPDKETPAWWLASGPMMLDNYIAWRQEHQLPIWVTPQGLPGIELEVEARLRPDLPRLRGFIDRVMVDPESGALVVVDLKSGSRTNPPRQLGIYKVLLEETYPGTSAAYGSYYEARKGKPTPLIDLSYYTKETVAELVDNYKRAVMARVFAPNPGTSCSTCTVRRYCPEMGGEDAGIIPPF